MDFSNFYIQHQNGDKEQLEQIKHGVRKDMLSSKFSKIFEAYDNNSNGTLEADELTKIFNGLTQIAQISQSQKDEDNRVLDFNENEVAKSIFLNIGKIENVDFMGFVKSVSDASQGVEKSTVNTTPDGGKEITTIYKNGAVETISYYPDGGYKYKIFDCKNDETKRCFTLNNEKYSEEAFELKIRKAYNNSVKLRSPDAEIAKIGSTEQDYQNFKNEFIKNNNVQSFLSTETVEIRHEVDLSERAKKDVEARNFVLQHYIDTHKATKEILSTMGYLDDIGAAINAGAGELWNKVKNLFNDNPVEYQNFYELCQKFESSYNHSLVENENLKKLQDHPEEYFNKSNFKMENAQQFKETTQQYYNAKALKMRLDLLDGAISGLTNSINLGNEFKKGSGRAALHYDTPPIADAREYLLEYFNGDEECVNLLLCGNDEKLSKEEALERVKTLDEKSQKYLLYPDEKDENVFHLITLGLSLIPNKEQALKTIKALKENTDKLYNNTLNGKTYNEIENKYKAEYKDIFKTDYIPEDLSEKTLAAKETACMVKMGAITIVSILVSKSPIMGRISAALAGNAEATGLAANYTRALVAKFGKTAVEEGIRLAMTCGTITESVGLTLLNQVTSERGYDEKEFLKTTTSEAKYLFVGAYLGAPLAQKVSGALGKLVNLEQLIKNSPKATNVATHTLKITGAELLQGLGALTTEGAIFTGLEVATEGNNLKDAISGQGETLSKLKLMNHIIAYMLGAKTHTLYKSNMSAAEKAKLQAANAQIEKAIEKSGIKNLEITRKETPEGTKITTSVFGSNRKSEFKNETELATALAEEVAKNFEGDIESLSEIQSFKNEVLPRTEQEIQASKAAQETTILTLQKLNKQFIDNGKSGKIYTTIDGRQLVEIETAPNSHKYDYYEFDKDKKLVTAMDNFSKEFFQDNFPDFLHIVPKDFGAKAKVENINSDITVNRANKPRAKAPTIETDETITVDLSNKSTNELYYESSKVIDEISKILNSEEKLDEFKENLEKLYNLPSDKFKEIVDSGFFNVLKKDINVLRHFTDRSNNLNDNITFSKHFLEDIKKINEKVPLIKTFEKGTTIYKMREILKNGDVGIINETLYVKDNGNIVKLNLTKSDFEKLFPLGERFATSQGYTGDCWFVSAIANLMESPIGRAKIYELFTSNPDGSITIKFPDADEGVPFKDGMPIKTNYSLYGCKGLQMVEQAYATKRPAMVDDANALDYEMVPEYDNNGKVRKHKNGNVIYNKKPTTFLQIKKSLLKEGKSVELSIDNMSVKGNDGLMTVLEGGFSTEAIDAVVGRKNLAWNNQENLKYVNETQLDAHLRLSKQFEGEMYASTNKNYDNTNEWQDKNKQILNDWHAYLIRDYYSENKIVSLANPWATNETISLSLAEFKKYFSDITLMGYKADYKN